MAGSASPWPSGRRRPVAPAPEDVDAAGRLAFGDEWARILPVLGRAQAGEVLRAALRTHAQTVSRSVVGLVPLTLGQLDAFHPYVAAARDVLGLRLGPHHLAHLDAFLAIARSAGPWFALPGVAFVSERPLVCRVDPEGRLHAEDGPALAYGDGVQIHAWHGVRVPASVILDPETIDLADILNEPNAEVRRVLTERFGVERFVRAPGSTLIHEDDDRPAVATLDHAAASLGRWGRGGPDGGGAQLHARARRHAQDVLPAGAAHDRDGPRGGGLDVQPRAHGLQAGRGDVASPGKGP